MERAGTKAAAILAVALTALAAGCGGGGSGRLSKSEYEQKLKAEGRQLKSAFSASDLENSKNINDLTTQVTRLQKELDQSASDLEALDPPQDAEADNTKLADALHKAAGKFGELKQAAKNLDQQKLQQLSQEVGTILQEGKAASDDLKKKGYDIGTLGED
jgi:uncharacterized protein HemX